MKTSIEENQTNYLPLLNNWKRSKNIPLDQEALISSLENVNTEIRIHTRYPGQTFFSIFENSLYFFDKNLQIRSYPKNNFIYIVIEKTNDIYDYSQLIENLASYKMTDCSFAYIKSLNIILFYNGNEWKYYGGQYTVTNIDEWNTLDISLKETNKYVLLGGNLKIITSDGTLSNEIITVTELPSNPENNRYYKYLNNLYYSISGTLYKLTSEQTSVFSIITNISKHPYYNDTKNYDENTNVIEHSLNSDKIEVKMILNTSNPENSDTLIYPIFKVIDNNNIMIYSNISLTNCIVYVENL